MRPVNLLPEGERARRPAAGGSGNASYVVLGVLGALLIGVVVLVLTQNQINSRTTEIARAEQQKAAAEERVERLGAFGDFTAIKETRVRSISELAKSRFDWERLMRELSLVLPQGTSLSEVTASTTGVGGAGAAPDPAAETSETAAPAGPAITLIGCSKSQELVAVMLVRLRKLHRATDVELSESAKADTPGASEGGASSSTDSAAVGGTEQCTEFTFTATVAFAPAPAGGPESENRRVPAVLGGGS